ncbi:MAG: response regulator [Patescibacteria group bacterium]|jgi:CheY-like chemotaxis protein
MKKLLIIDDEPIVLKALSSQFDAGQVKVLLAKDGVEGLRLAKKEKPDLILLDLVMPKMDGLEMLAKLRKDRWGKKAEVVILSNLSDSAKVAQAVALGTFEYLVKVDWNVADVAVKVQQKLGIK